MESFIEFLEMASKQLEQVNATLTRTNTKADQVINNLVEDANA